MCAIQLATCPGNLFCVYMYNAQNAKNTKVNMCARIVNFYEVFFIHSLHSTFTKVIIGKILIMIYIRHKLDRN